MTKDEFNYVLARVGDAFPKKTYGVDQLTRLFHEIKALPVRSFQDAIISLLDNSAFHPTINAIRQACYPYLQKIRAETREFSSCRFCYGKGHLDIIERRNGSEVRLAALCPYCDAGPVRGLLPAYFMSIGRTEFEGRDFLHRRTVEFKELLRSVGMTTRDFIRMPRHEAWKFLEEHDF